MHDKLIYGKDETQRIVSIEPMVSAAALEVFTEDESNNVNSHIVSNRYWILSNQNVDGSFTRLNGNLHYKYGKQFTTRSEFISFKKQHQRSDLYSIYDPKESAMVKDGITYFKGMKPQDVSILSFDIETTTLDPTAPGASVLLISNTLRKGNKVERRLFAYTDHDSDVDMVNAWCDWVKEQNPSIICGHNIYSFDLKYLYEYMDKMGHDLRLGRNDTNIRFEEYESKFRVDGTRDLHYNKVRCYGRELIDTMFLAYKYDIGRKYESYGLKKIIAQEGLEAKDRIFYDASQIRFKYKDPEEWELIKQYCLHDADDALKLFDLMSPPFFYMTQSVPKSFQSMIESASGSQINSVMTRSYLQEKHSIPKASMTAEYEGAISFGNPGVYRNVFKVDVASLYPSIMIEYKVHSPEKDPNKNFLNLVQTFTERRLYHKSLAKTDKYHDDMQAAFKIFINSCYGFLGSTGLNFNMPQGAAFITKTGRDILSKAIEWAEGKKFKIVNADTDSISFTKEHGDDFSNDDCNNLLKDLNSLYPSTIRFENDGLYKCVIVFKAKNYVLYDGKKIKTKGSAIKATTKEPALREFINTIINSIIDGRNDYDNIYKAYVKEALNVKDIKRWVSRKTISDKVLNPQRTNEQKIFDIIQNTNISEGDRIYCFFKSDGSLGLAEEFSGDYDKDKMLEKLYKTSEIFDTVIPEGTFINYKLKKNKKALEEIVL
jgi:DNA polymerase elongation subunit (family B)